ncbi:hypothetical protein MFFC18_18200 [Mariniblastus fucicola]|uniref:Uncharacterized protein n=1 Tax=Mariniblastus fucicola TaxID=980251 RepID=A0A5B9P946_9BACT|nr:hypothetical protein MFFC18_18200 [Mariniblastus fucicola]
MHVGTRSGLMNHQDAFDRVRLRTCKIYTQATICEANSIKLSLDNDQDHRAGTSDHLFQAARKTRLRVHRIVIRHLRVYLLRGGLNYKYFFHVIYAHGILIAAIDTLLKRPVIVDRVKFIFPICVPQGEPRNIRAFIKQSGET